MNTAPVHGVLFDLDGTLLDTAPDFLHVLNTLRAIEGLPPLERAAIVPWISRGSAHMVRQGLACQALNLENLHARFLDEYAAILGQYTQPFAGIDTLLNQLDTLKLPWGIVTNKPRRFTEPLVQHCALRAHCVISGDTLNVQKPDPAPVLAGCTALGLDPAHVVYCGDAIQDMVAGHGAGCRTILAQFGYLDPTDNPATWPVTHAIDSAAALYPWLSTQGLIGAHS